MSLNYYPKVERFVIDASKNAGDQSGITHYQRTVHWVKYLKPDADEALLIAAIAHDIERPFRGVSYGNITGSSKGFKDEDHLKHHQLTGAQITSGFLKSIGADTVLIDRVYMLISGHEVGGNEDQNLLKDADSLSFFENNVDSFVTKQVERTSKEKVKDKFDWMFNRISSNEAKGIAKPWYVTAINKLG